MARRRRRLAHDRSWAIALLVLTLFIAGEFIYAETFEPRFFPKTRDVATGMVVIEVIPPQNNTEQSSVDFAPQSNTQLQTSNLELQNNLRGGGR